MQHIGIIVAVGNNFEIGLKNRLLWHLPNDLKYFKEKTLNATIIMGKNTYLSLPIKPLPKRRNIVITDIYGETFEGAETVYSIEEALEKTDANQERFIVGGASIYRQFLPLTDTLYLTRVHESFEADTYFPEIDFKAWNLVFSQDGFKDATHPYDYTFEVWKRI